MIGLQSIVTGGIHISVQHIKKISRLIRKITTYRALLALQLLGSVTSFIGRPHELPDGLDTVVGESGFMLSGG